MHHISFWAWIHADLGGFGAVAVKEPLYTPGPNLAAQKKVGPRGRK